MSAPRAYLAGCLTVATVVVLDVCGRLWLLAPPVAILAALWTWGGVRHARRGARWD